MGSDYSADPLNDSPNDREGDYYRLHAQCASPYFVQHGLMVTVEGNAKHTEISSIFKSR